MSVNIYDATDGQLKPFVGGTFYVECPIASILPYGGSEPPDGWLLCQGQEVAKIRYQDLYNVIGESFGTASDNTKFVLPDMRESVPKGAGLTSKSSNHMDADGLAVGEFLDDRIQNFNLVYRVVTGSTAGGVMATDADGQQYPNPISQQTTSGRFGATTEVKSVGVNYIIKALLTGQPVELSITTTDWNTIEEII